MQGLFFSVLISICVLIDFYDGHCKTIKTDGINNLKCEHTTLQEISENKFQYVSTIFITLSKINKVLANTFTSFGPNLESLSLQNCEIVEVDYNAFSGLEHLKKLSLNSNNISAVYSQWFNDLTSLEELDLSFNKIKSIDASVFRKLLNLRNLNLNNNQINCLGANELEPMRSLAKIRIDGNPLSFICRGKLTLWLKDKGIHYASESDGFKYREDTLDSLIWRCGIDFEIGDNETLMKECVIMNLYNQVQTALISSCSFPTVATECINERSALVRCIQKTGNGNINNGEAVRKLLLALRSGSKRLN